MPFHDFSCIPTAAAFRAVSKESVVCLTGDGGDEMFAGYTEPLLFRGSPVTAESRGAVRGLVRTAFSRASGLGRVGSRLEKWSRLGALPHEEAFATIRDFIWNGAIQLRRPAARDELRSAFSGMVEAYRRTDGSAVHRYLQAHAATQFANGFLAKVDVASMAYSVEARTPFLSPEIAALAARAPAEWLLRGGQQKRILKDLALRFLPAEVVLRTEAGLHAAAWELVPDEPARARAAPPALERGRAARALRRRSGRRAAWPPTWRAGRTAPTRSGC